MSNFRPFLTASAGLSNLRGLKFPIFVASFLRLRGSPGFRSLRQVHFIAGASLDRTFSSRRGLDGLRSLRRCHFLFGLLRHGLLSLERRSYEGRLVFLLLLLGAGIEPGQLLRGYFGAAEAISEGGSMLELSKPPASAAHFLLNVVDSRLTFRGLRSIPPGQKNAAALVMTSISCSVGSAIAIMAFDFIN